MLVVRVDLTNLVDFTEVLVDFAEILLRFFVQPSKFQINLSVRARAFPEITFVVCPSVCRHLSTNNSQPSTKAKN